MRKTIFCEQLFCDFSEYFDAYLGKVGLELDVVKEPSYEMPESAFVELFELAGETEFPNIGITIGSMIKPQHVGALGHAVVNAPNVRVAVNVLVDYVVTYSHYARLTSTNREGVLEIEYDISEQTITSKKHDAEFAITAIYRLLSLCAGRPLRVRSVHFFHDKPKSGIQNYNVFNSPVYFNASKSKLVLSKSELLATSKLGDLRLYEVLITHLEKVKRSRIIADFKECLENLIISQIDLGRVNIDSIAKQLGISVRSLQRKLEENEICFRKLLSHVRYQLAIVYLADSKLSLTDVSNKLAYNELSSFSRAFKKWASISPKLYRSSLNNKST